MVDLWTCSLEILKLRKAILPCFDMVEIPTHDVNSKKNILLKLYFLVSDISDKTI